jgi:hypothetical protein
MGKMEKLSKLYLDGAYVKQVQEKTDVKKCMIKYLTEPKKEKNQKYGNDQYNVDVQVAEIEVLERDEEGKPTEYGKHTGKKIKMTWTMNTRSSDFLGEKYENTEDFIGKEEELVVVQVTTREGLKDSIYPAELMPEARPEAS